VILWWLACTAPKEGGFRQGDPAADSGGPGLEGGSGGGADGGDGAGDGGGTEGGAEGGGEGDGDSGEALPEEMRGVWVSRWTWSDREDIEAIMADIASGGFNAVFFQVRGTFDAYYNSAHEPWASRLSGTLGEDPGWDPLQVALDAAHAQGLELHAWLNTFPLWSGTTLPPESSPAHALLAHPDWLVADEGGEAMALNSSYVFASPGHAEVRARVAAVTADIAEHYEVDGIHLDYIRYPDPGMSHDAASEAAYADDDLGLSWEDWQREQVKETVRGVYSAVDVPVTAAVWGIHTNIWGWSAVSQGNIDYYQDSHAFLEEGLLDATLPMIYWPVTETVGDRLDYRTLVADHVAHRGERHVYAGLGTEDLSYEQLIDCIIAAREEGAQGVVLFDYSTFSAHMPDFRTDVFGEAAKVPELSWR
jgi:uncharacterized lipoprotein YddW (UPF0748 family)